MPGKRPRSEDEPAQGEEPAQDALMPMTAEDKEEAARMEEIAKRAEKRAEERAAAKLAAQNVAESTQQTITEQPTISTTVAAAPPKVEKAGFMSKKEREKAALARLAAKRNDAEDKAKDAKDSFKRFASGQNDEDKRRDERRAREREEKERERRNVEESRGNKEAEKELEAVKKAYLGGKKEKPLIKRDKKKDKFKMDYDVSEDTSRHDFNPLYNNRMQVNVLFGRGFQAGIDQREQKKNSNFLQALGDKRMQEMRELERGDNTLTEADKRKNEKERKQASQAIQNQKNAELSHLDEIAKKQMGLHWKDKQLKDMQERDWRIFREDFDIRIQGGRATHPLRYWKEASFPDEIMRAVDSLGYKDPSPIQRQAIPIGLARRDIIGIAETGSGKTAAFTIPLLTILLRCPAEIINRCAEEGPLAVIMAPTRELAQQIEEECIKLAQYTPFKTACVVGGQDIESQGVLLREGVQVVIGTPGRMVDLIQSNYLVLNQCNYIVLDEADRMVDMGFEEALTVVLDAMGGLLKSEDEEKAMTEAAAAAEGNQMVRVTAMFSATMSPEVQRIAKRYLRHPAIIKIGDEDSGKNKRIEQRIEFISEGAKKSRIASELRRLRRDDKCIIFVNAKKQGDTIQAFLEKADFHCGILHGGKSQEQREDTLESFRAGNFKILVATDVAGRGLDIPDVSHVFNFDMSQKIEAYTHRIGRTGRAGKSGVAITFLTDNDAEVMYDLKKYLESTNSAIPDSLKKHQAAQQPYGTRNEEGKIIGQKKKFND